MGIVQRFERKLEGAVGDAFARVFGGTVVPQEVESALQREASDKVQNLDGGHRLAPNQYVITISDTDQERLAADRELTVKSFAKHLEGYIRDQGWQTYGDVVVSFEQSPALHTGQFRTRSLVNPDLPHPEPGVAPMTQHPGYEQGHTSGAESVSVPPQNDQAQANQSSYPPAYEEPLANPADFGHPQGYYSPADPQYRQYQEPNYDPTYPASAHYPQQSYQTAYPNGGYQHNEYQQPPTQAAYQPQQPLTVTLQLEDGSGRTYQLREGVSVIGRGQDAQFRLPDTGVSRRHAEIRWDGHIALLTDLGSTNGTTVNGASVQQWQLAHGDLIRAGHSEILVRIY
ncbi:MAG: FhaA domain-containing protein [Mycobacteriaceae bacterium]